MNKDATTAQEGVLLIESAGKVCMRVLLATEVVWPTRAHMVEFFQAHKQSIARGNGGRA